MKRKIDGKGRRKKLLTWGWGGRRHGTVYEGRHCLQQNMEGSSIITGRHMGSTGTEGGYIQYWECEKCLFWLHFLRRVQNNKHHHLRTRVRQQEWEIQERKTDMKVIWDNGRVDGLGKHNYSQSALRSRCILCLCRKPSWQNMGVSLAMFSFRRQVQTRKS